MICVVTRDLGRYLDEQADLEARADALESEFDNAMSEVPEQVAEVIRHWLGKDDAFAQAIDDALEAIIAARNEP